MAISSSSRRTVSEFSLIVNLGDTVRSNNAKRKTSAKLRGQRKIEREGQKRKITLNSKRHGSDDSQIEKSDGTKRKTGST